MFPSNHYVPVILVVLDRGQGGYLLSSRVPVTISTVHIDAPQKGVRFVFRMGRQWGDLSLSRVPVTNSDISTGALQKGI